MAKRLMNGPVLFRDVLIAQAVALLLIGVAYGVTLSAQSAPGAPHEQPLVETTTNVVTSLNPHMETVTLSNGSGVKTICFSAESAVDTPTLCVPVVAIKEAFKGFGPGTVSAYEQAGLNQRAAEDQVLISRAALAQCQAALGPLETDARKADRERALAALRAQYESWHPQWSLDDQGRPVKKQSGKK